MHPASKIHRLRAFVLPLALAAASSGAWSATCDQLDILLSPTPCSGAFAQSLVQFNGSGPIDPFFDSSAAYANSDAPHIVRFTEKQMPEVPNPYREVAVQGSIVARSNVTGESRDATASASSAASLLTGALRVRGTSSDPNASPVVLTVIDSAALRDQITVSFAKNLLDVSIGISMAVNGSITGGPAALHASFSALTMGGDVLLNRSIQHASPGIYSTTLGGTILLGRQVDAGDHWEATFDLLAGLVHFDTGSNVTVDFFNTATLRLQLPQGATYRSDSGVFLAAVVAPPIPEPETYALMIAGLALLTATGRRRRNGS